MRVAFTHRPLRPHRMPCRPVTVLALPEALACSCFLHQVLRSPHQLPVSTRLPHPEANSLPKKSPQ